MRDIKRNLSTREAQTLEQRKRNKLQDVLKRKQKLKKSGIIKKPVRLEQFKLKKLKEQKRSKLKSILDKLSGAKETISDYASAAKTSLETRKMKETLIRKRAQNKFRKTYGFSYDPADESRKDNSAYKKMIKEEKERYKSL